MGPGGLALLLLALAHGALAGEVRLKNGITLKGTPVKVETLYTGPRKPRQQHEIAAQPILMISSPVKRYFLPRFQQEEVVLDVDLGRSESFTLKQEKRSGASRELGMVGGFVETPPPFDEFGRRTVRLAGPNGDIPVIQGMTEINPDSIRLAALNYKWETAIATSSLPADQLDAVLRKITDSDNLDHRLKIARFYIQAQNFKLAEQELQAIREKFPEQQQSIETVRQSLLQDRAQQILLELKLRQRAGQHAFVAQALSQFPTENVAPTILREVRDLQSGYDQSLEKSARIRDLLAELQSQLGDAEQAQAVSPLRAEILQNLNHANIGRLDSFLNLSIDPNLPSAEKLALALSGWVVGSDNASTDLDQAIRLWQARTLVLDYLRGTDTGGSDRRQIIEAIESLEGVGPQRIAQLLPLLPDPGDPAGATAGQITTIQASGPRDEIPLTYSIYLPPEYHPEQAYPAIVALHSEGRTPAQEAAFWAGTNERPGQASRHGYIVIAPEFITKSGQTAYDYSAAAHQQILESLRDAGRRFSIDHNRVFLSGHMMGADAAFDIGFSHPDLFAGVIPIAGVSDQICQFYWENARLTPFYVVLGELDRETVYRNTRELERMMRARFDVLFVEFVGSGPDSFYGEIHSLFDWMSRMQRNRLPRKFDARVLRTSENRFYWLDIGDVPAANRYSLVEGDRKSVPKPLRISAEVVQPANRIDIINKTARTRLRLTPEGGFINFDKKLQVVINGKQRFSDFIKPDTGAMLESARVQGDRRNICWAILEL